jgi:hypothetical protein
MKTYEITATLHDGRVVYQRQIIALNTIRAIVIFKGLYPEYTSQFQTLNVKELTI